MGRTLEQAQKDFVRIAGIGGGSYEEHRLIIYITPDKLGRKVEDHKNLALEYIQSLDFQPEYLPGIIGVFDPANRPSFDSVITRAIHEAVALDDIELAVAILGKITIGGKGLFELFSLTGFVIKHNSTYAGDKKPGIFDVLLQSSIFERLDGNNKDLLLWNLVRLNNDYTNRIEQVIATYDAESVARINYGFLLNAAAWNDNLKCPGAVKHVDFLLGKVTDKGIIDGAFQRTLDGATGKWARGREEGENKSGEVLLLEQVPVIELTNSFYPLTTKPISETLAMAALKTNIPAVLEKVVSEVTDDVLLVKLFNAATAANSLTENKIKLHLLEKCGDKISQNDLLAAATNNRKSSDIFFKVIARITDDEKKLELFDAVAVKSVAPNTEVKNAALRLCAELLKEDKVRLYAAAKAAIKYGDPDFLGTAKDGVIGFIIANGHGQILGTPANNGGCELLFLAARFEQGLDQADKTTAGRIDKALGMMARLYRACSEHCPDTMTAFDDSGGTPKSVIVKRIEQFAPAMRNDDRLRIFDLEMKKIEAGVVAGAEMRSKLGVLKEALELAGPGNAGAVLAFLTGGMPPVTQRGDEQPRQLGDNKDHQQSPGQ